jgi:hypothetical protein
MEMSKRVNASPTLGRKKCGIRETTGSQGWIMDMRKHLREYERRKKRAA